MQSFAHTLVVGGSGMLAAATLDLAARSARLSAIARTERSLARLRAQAEDGAIDTLALDYQDHAAFRLAVAELCERQGPPDLVLAWFHRGGPALELAAQLASLGGPLRYVQLLGSASADPAADLDGRRAPFDALAGLRYQQVVLGFVLEGDRSRWLRDDEISAGALAAIASGAAASVVGVVQPWERRP